MPGVTPAETDKNEARRPPSSQGLQRPALQDLDASAVVWAKFGICLGTVESWARTQKSFPVSEGWLHSPIADL